MKTLRRFARLCIACSLGAGLAIAAGGVRLTPLPPAPSFPEAVEPDSLAYACADDAAELAEFFADNQLAFDPSLVRPRGEASACHIHYEPTLRGFRASRDNEAAIGLYSSINPYSFLANSEVPGDSLEIVKEILSRLSRPLDVRLTVSGGFSKSLWEPAAIRHFGGLPHRFTFFQSVDSISHPWAQDHIKAGRVGGAPQVLIPRRLYETSAGDDQLTRGRLQSLEEQGFVRSKLSWEGGSLQFVADPQDPSKTILVRGGGTPSWETALDAAETSYVLGLEFGADQVLDLGAARRRADDLVAFLPDENVVLVAQMPRGNADVARAAAFELLETFSEPSPPAAVRGLASLLAMWEQDLRVESPQLQDAIAAARQALAAEAPQDDPELSTLLAAYVARHCPGSLESCFNSEQEILDSDPELFRRTSSHTAVNLLRSRLRSMLLAIIEQQTDRSAWPEERALDSAAAKLSSWGFHVVTVPYLKGGGQPSVSYVNALVIDQKVFVPTLGLRRFEERIFSQLRRDLQGRYQVIPVDARTALTRAGGVRRAFGVFRAIPQ